MDDHWLGPLEEALEAMHNAQGAMHNAQGRMHKAEGAPGLFVACLGNRPALPETRLPVHFRDYDLLATLDSLLSWCEAIHAGDPSPPPPVLATF